MFSGEAMRKLRKRRRAFTAERAARGSGAGAKDVCCALCGSETRPGCSESHSNWKRSTPPTTRVIKSQLLSFLMILLLEEASVT